ncbi:MFS multidrug transporter [Aspergillus bombycis]|uniref:MFS multidrug transporter n=1 Tax=Aspergillus bombycis TaxID=109264 RepID=A0A1F7ZMF1_9EURO|nr:MFS multidrug transporter [Aspergillus bombycis]OGM40624.1 MFS multidrug transporter [Aspergillus bombycis]
MLTRLFAGFFDASPLALVLAVFTGIYNNRHRGVAIAMFAMAVFVGSFASPFTGGFITMSNFHWRWTMYIAAIMGFFGSAVLLCFFREIHAKQDEVEVDFNHWITVNFSRPFHIWFTEPVAFLVTLYTSFIYGLMYALLGAYPVVSQQIHGMNLGVGSLPFIGLITGEFAGAAYTLLSHPAYTKRLVANNDIPVPEWRLSPVIVG